MLPNYDHVSDPTVLRALGGDDTAFDAARRTTFAAWWDDNNEGEQVATLLSDRDYQRREQAVLGMGEEGDPIPFSFLDALRRYWS